ncbi:MAG: hypothetical protein IH588_02945 [Anaerolineales bacterium]|nr:hypothetical protein [Anaerolineales bacterium]
MKFFKRLSLFEVALVIAILSIHLYAALSDAYNFPNAWFKRDDAYYYFKVAQNITQGLGSTFDGINLTNGYHPLWMIICIPIFTLAQYDLILPLRILLMVMAVFQAGSAVLIYRLVKKHLSSAVAILAASYWAFNFYIHSTVYEYGLETPIAVFTLLCLVYRLSVFEKEWHTKPVTTRQLVEIGLLATLVMFSRLDLVFLAVIVGVWIVFRKTMIRYLLPLDVLIIFASMTASAALRTGLVPYNAHYAAAAVETAVLAIVIKIMALYFFGAYQPLRANPLWKTFRQIFFALTVSTIFLTAIFMIRTQFGAELNFPRSALLVDWGISLFFIFALRLPAYWFSSSKPLDGNESPWLEFKSNWKNWLTEGLTYFGVIGGFLSLYMLFNKFMFGTSSPVSGQIKRWWGTMPYTTYEEPPSNWFSFFGVGRHTFNAWDPATDLFSWLADILRPLIPGADKIAERYYISMLIFVIAGFVIAFANKRRTIQVGSKLALIPLMAGSGIQILSYTATAYGGLKEWYWVSELVLIILVGSFFIDLVLRPLLKIKYINLAAQTIAIAFGLFMAGNFFNFVQYAMPHGYFEPTRRPMDVLTYLEENTPPGSIIGMTGGGNVGYFINGRTIVNMDGLINSNDYFHALQAGEAPTYLYERGLTIIFANAKMLSLPPFYDQFSPYLLRYNQYGGKALFYLLEEPKY